MLSPNNRTLNPEVEIKMAMVGGSVAAKDATMEET